MPLKLYTIGHLRGKVKDRHHRNHDEGKYRKSYYNFNESKSRMERIFFHSVLESSPVSDKCGDIVLMIATSIPYHF